MTLSEDGLICGYALGGEPAVRPLDWSQIDPGTLPDAPLHWINLDRNAPAARDWLETRSGLESLTVEALLQEDTRPRLAPAQGGLLVILRGVNLNPGADPEDMVSMRLWMDATRVISLHGKPLRAVAELRRALADGDEVPGDGGELLAALVERLTALMAPVIHDLEEQLDTLEERVLEDPARATRAALIVARRRGIILRRYIAPLRDLLARLALEREGPLEPRSRARLRECWDRVVRYVEDLEALRERATVTQEELASTLSDRMNRNMYTLSLVATVFLPLGFVTGLLGVNLGGLPGTEDPSAFLWLCLALGGMALIVWLFFHLRRWL